MNKCTLSIAIYLLIASAAIAQQTLTDVTTINNGSLWVNPPPTGSDAITLYGGVDGPISILNPTGMELLSGVSSGDPGNFTNSLLSPGGVLMTYGHAVSSTASRQDLNGYIGLITSGAKQGLGFYTDQVAGSGNISNDITSNAALNYVWHRPVSSSLNEDITLRSVPVMWLGGDHNALTVVHPTDDTKTIILDPYNGTITVNGSLVLTQASAASTYATITELTNLGSQIASDYVSKSATTLALGTGVTASGTGAVAFGSMSVVNADLGFAQGDHTWVHGNSAVAFGQYSGASGQGAFSAGAWSNAEGNYSAAIGLWTYAGKEAAIALGGPNICAKGANSFAAGSWSTAWGDRSASLGYGLWVTQPNQIVLGLWNDSTRSGLPADLVFVVGNGLEPADPIGRYTPNTNSNQSNAIEVELSGRTTIRNKNYQTDTAAEALIVQGAATISGNLTSTQSSVFQASFVVEGEIDPADSSFRTVIAKENQEILVPEQGDISMGEFRSGSLPVSP